MKNMTTRRAIAAAKRRSFLVEDNSTDIVVQDVDLEKLEADVSCVFCHKTGNQPRLITCGHTACTPCLDKHTSGLKIFVCTKCQSKVEVPQGGIKEFRDNTFAATLHELQTLKQGKGGQCAYSNNKNPHDHPSVYCKVCNESLCCKCQDQHQESRYTKNHKLISVDEINFEQVEELRGKSMEFCSKHPDEVLSFYCEPCKIPICVHCALGTHSKHDRIDLQDMVASCGESIQLTVLQAQATAREYDDRISEIDEYIKAYETKMLEKKTEISKMAQVACDRINNDANGLISKLQDCFGKYSKKLQAMQEECKSQIAALKNAESNASSVLKHSIPVEVVSSSSNLQNQVDMIDQSLLVGDLTDDIIFRPMKHAAWPDGQNMIGEIMTRSTLLKAVPVTNLRSEFFVKSNPCQVVISHIPGCLTIGGLGELAVYTLEGTHHSDITGPFSGHIYSVAETKDGALFITDYNLNSMFHKPSPTDSWHEFAPGEFEDPTGLALSEQGNIVVVDEGKKTIVTLTPQGKVISTIDITRQGAPCNSPCYLAIGNNGEILVSDWNKHCVNIFRCDGSLKKTLGTPGKSGMKNKQFNQPRGIAIDEFGNIAVADISNNRIQLFSSKGEFKKSLLTNEDGIDGPWGVTFTKDEKLIVVEVHTKKIKLFDYKL